ncbi:hypothetical protein ACB288_22830, partial [Aeromonas taiwanensis]
AEFREQPKRRFQRQTPHAKPRRCWIEHSLACFKFRFLNRPLGDEWWYDLPMVDNPDYTYLCRIIQAVRDGLREYTKSTPAAAA